MQQCEMQISILILWCTSIATDVAIVCFSQKHAPNITQHHQDWSLKKFSQYQHLLKRPNPNPNPNQPQPIPPIPNPNPQPCRLLSCPEGSTPFGTSTHFSEEASASLVHVLLQPLVQLLRQRDGFCAAYQASPKRCFFGCWTKNRGVFYPPKWMVKIMENPIRMDDLGGFPLFLETSI